jgi:uncharacterized membrane protein YqjE
MADYPTQDDRRSVGELVADISEKTSLLVREEIELAKAEVNEKVSKLIRGTVVGIAAGVFLLLFLAMLMHALAWLLNDLFFEDNVWVGFLIEAGLWLLLAGLAGLLAYRAVQQGAPPTPDLAIEEAKRTKETLTGGEPRETATGMGATPETIRGR